MTQPRPAAVVVLAAGLGKRMRSSLPKVLHDVAGRPLLSHVLAAADGLGPERTVVVVGHGRDHVEEMLSRRSRRLESYDNASYNASYNAPSNTSTQSSNGIRHHPATLSTHATVSTVLQERPGGTGHAVRVAMTALEDLSSDDTLVVMPGDAPLLTSATLTAMLAAHRDQGASATLLSAVVPDATGYGRVVRASDGAVRAVVEHRDADQATLAVNEINGGVYAFTVGPLRDSLARLTTTNSQGEEYLTEVVELLVADGQPVAAYCCEDPDEVVGVNDRLQLAAAGRLLRDRILTAAMLSGTTVVDPATTWIDAEVTLEPDTTVWPNTFLRGRTHLGRGSVVGPDCTLTDTVVGAGAVVQRTTAEDAEIGPDAVVGPYTHLRAGTRLGASGKLGAFVETKSAEFGEGAKVPHLAYVGDAVVGARTNIGCTAVFVNYDGVSKHRTVIGSDVRIGSDTMLVAPVTVGDGAYTAAGAVVKEDVPPGALAVREGLQRNVEGWVERRRPGSAAARAARQALDALDAKEARDARRESGHSDAASAGVQAREA